MKGTYARMRRRLCRKWAMYYPYPGFHPRFPWRGPKYRPIRRSVSSAHAMSLVIANRASTPGNITTTNPRCRLLVVIHTAVDRWRLTVSTPRAPRMPPTPVRSVLWGKDVRRAPSDCFEANTKPIVRCRRDPFLLGANGRTGVGTRASGATGAGAGPNAERGASSPRP